MDVFDSLPAPPLQICIKRNKEYNSEHLGGNQSVGELYLLGFPGAWTWFMKE